VHTVDGLRYSVLFAFVLKDSQHTNRKLVLVKRLCLLGLGSSGGKGFFNIPLYQSVSRRREKEKEEDFSSMKTIWGRRHHDSTPSFLFWHCRRCCRRRPSAFIPGHLGEKLLLSERLLYLLQLLFERPLARYQPAVSLASLCECV
jgi:hypothetical protein